MEKLILLVISISIYGVTAAQSNDNEQENILINKFLSGCVFLNEHQKPVAEIPWSPHPTFKGVYLKHLITGTDTQNRFSYHIVKIEPGCTLDTHLHDGKTETHEVVCGSGKMNLDGKEIDYIVGAVCFIPDGTPHKVIAGNKGMYLLAKFSPAL